MVDYGEMSLLGGLAQGIAQGQMFKRKMEQDAAQKEERDQLLKAQSEMAKLQMQKYKLEMKRLEQEAADAEVLRPIVQKKLYGQFGINPGAEPSAAQGGQTQFSPNFKQPQAQGQQADILDEILAIQEEMAEGAMLDKATGGKYGFEKQAQAKLEAMKLRMTSERNQTARDSYNRGWLEQTVQNVPVPGAPPGTTMPMRIPKYGGAATPIEGVGVTPPQVGNVTVNSPEGQFNQPTNIYSGQPEGPPIKTGDVKGESADTAARVALATQGLQHVAGVKKMFMPDGKTVNRELVFSANMPMGGVGEGRQALAMFLDALDARARAATGAAMPDTEVKNYTKMYFPHPLDNDATIRNKLQRLEGFLGDYLKTLDPSGNMRKRLQRTPPKEAIDKMQEGVVTTFGNGEKWTLQNGQPVRVP